MQSYRQQIINVVSGRSPQFAIDAKSIIKIMTILSNSPNAEKKVLSTLTDMYKKSQIGRIRNNPYCYYDAEFINMSANAPKEENGLMSCMMRNDRKITRDICVPNPEARECNICEWRKK